MVYGATLLLLTAQRGTGELELKYHIKMKKLKVLVMMLCIAAMGFATSCSKEDEDTIVGEWKLTYAAQTVVQVDYYGEVHNISWTTKENPLDAKWQFTKDGIIYSQAKYSNGEVYEHQDRYVVLDGYLVLSQDEDMFWVKKYKIEKLTNEKLILTYNYDGEIPDHMAEYTQDVWLEFEKD